MKKKWLVAVTVIAVAMGIGLWQNRESDIPTVKTVTVEPQRVEQTVSCSGVVEAGDSRGIFVPISCVIREVKVSEGQAVKQGDVLAVVDKEATRSKIDNDPASLLMLAAMSEKLTAVDNGIIVAVKAKPGETLERGTPCAVMALQRALQVRVTIREKDLPVMKSGQEVRISGDGFRRECYTGKLTDISSAATLSGNTAVVTGVVMLNEGQTDTSMRLGLSAKATVVTKVRQDGLLLPYEAVQAEENGQEFVYILSDGCACKCPVTAAAHLREGVLLQNDSLRGKRVITQPEKVTVDGMAIKNGGEDTP